MNKCVFCETSFNIDLNEDCCKNCGRKIIREVNLITFCEVYGFVSSQQNALSQNFIDSRNRQYSPDKLEKIPIKRVLSEYLTRGYIIRASEILFKNLLFDNFEYKIESDQELMEAIRDEIENHEEVLTTLWLLDRRGYGQDSLEHVKQFSIVGVDFMTHFMHFTLKVLSEEVLKELRNDRFEAIFSKDHAFGTIACGYHFKLAEEILEAHAKNPNYQKGGSSSSKSGHNKTKGYYV